LTHVILPNLTKIENDLVNKSLEWAGDAMLARTHGQPATPTTLGK
jgi:adenylosuccinate lyase